MACKECICYECKRKEYCSDNDCDSCQYNGRQFATADNTSDGCYDYAPVNKME